MRNRVLWGAVLAGACVTAVACGGGNKNADTARITTAATSTTPAPAPAAPALNDSNIVAMLDAVNAGDSAGGKMASTKGTNAQVKEFGRTMIRDHHALRKAGQDLAKKDSIGLAMPQGDTVIAHVKAVQDSLAKQAKGAAWDKAYIDAEVATHQTALSFLQQAQGAAQHSDLKDAIGKAIPTIQNHLTMAQNIQSKLNTTASAGGDSTKKP